MKPKKLQIACRDQKYETKQSVNYFVTTIGELQPCTSDFNRCIGYYETLKYARDVINNNCRILHEHGAYQYIVIEAFGIGWYPNAQKEEWYIFYDKGNKIKKIKKPKIYEQMCNFGIG